MNESNYPERYGGHSFFNHYTREAGFFTNPSITSTGPSKQAGFFTNSSAASTVPSRVVDYLYIPTTDDEALLIASDNDIEHTPIARLDYVKEIAANVQV